MNFRWKTAGMLVGINITAALLALVALGENDPKWIEPPVQTAETTSQNTAIKLAGVIPSFGR